MVTTHYHNVLQWLNVLVVEYDSASLDIMRAILIHFGATVYTAENGKVALEKLETLTPSFIISDINMPVMDGWQLIMNLKKDRRFAAIPAIGLTAQALPPHPQQADKLGFHAFLIKPLRIETFAQQLINALRSIPAVAERLNDNATL